MVGRVLIESAGDAAARDHVRAVTVSSGSSFLAGMRSLPPPQREAMFAVYAFCREVDDIADSDAPTAERLSRLAEWREEVDRLYAGRPRALTARALAGPVETYDLPREEFIALIEGMEMDAREMMRGRPFEDLEAYCRRVAGAVGLLSIRVFGDSRPRAHDFALFLGAAFQLTNILRDLAEDAARERLYLPRELLDAHGLPDSDPVAVLRHPNLARVCDDLAEFARGRFEEASIALADCSAQALKPAVVMMAGYRRLLDRLVRRGWTRLDEPVRLSTPEKAWIVARYGLL